MINTLTFNLICLIFFYYVSYPFKLSAPITLHNLLFCFSLNNASYFAQFPKRYLLLTVGTSEFLILSATCLIFMSTICNWVSLLLTTMCSILFGYFFLPKVLFLFFSISVLLLYRDFNLFFCHIKNRYII